MRIRLLIATLLFAHAAFAADLTKPVVKGPVGTKIDDFMTRLERIGYSGALLVAKDGDVVIHKAYGWRDAEAKLPYTIDTASTVGSITKQFTAAGILALEEAGKLKTTDLMSKYLPDVPEDKQSITLHQLLTHSAGFPDAIGDDYEETGREEFVKRAMASKLAFAPGTGYRYSNVGYSLLGAIIEKLTGGPYERYLHDRLFVRAGMEHTGYVIPKWDRAKLAHGVNDGQPWGTNLDRPWAPDGPYWHLRANGGILSTPADMYRWSLALDGDKVLSAASRKKLFTPHVREGEMPSSYGYGWTIFPMPNGHTIVAHNGGNGIFAADFRRYVDDGAVLFITSNVSDRPAIAASRFVGRIAVGQQLPWPPKIVNLPSEALKKVEGTYDGVKVTATPAGAIALTPLTPEAFARLGPPAGPRARGIEEVNKKAVDVAKGDQAITRLEGRFGALKNATLVGSVPQREMLASIVRLDFERDTRYLKIVWDGPEQIAGIRVLDALPPAMFYPLSETEFANYDMQSGETKSIKFVDGKLVL